jgi:enamine deaminase RidA (YjgF/YER057c/UK114 family)
VSVTLSHPDELLQQPDYEPVAVGTGSRIVMLAGQTGTHATGEVASRDLAGQTHRAMQNVVIGVKGAGGSVSDIGRLTVFVVGWTEDMAAELMEGFARTVESEGLSTPLPPFTLIGVQSLWNADLLVEIEAIAVID